MRLILSASSWINEIRPFIISLRKIHNQDSGFINKTHGIDFNIFWSDSSPLVYIMHEQVAVLRLYQFQIVILDLPGFQQSATDLFFQYKCKSNYTDIENTSFHQTDLIPERIKHSNGDQDEKVSHLFQIQGFTSVSEHGKYSE